MAEFALTRVITFLCFLASVSAYETSQQRLNRFQAKYNNSRSDIIFMLDVSGSLNCYSFEIEKQFVKSLLSKISVQPIATHVAVITFGQGVYREIDYIDYGLMDKNKCTFTKEFQSVAFRNERATNMNGALIRGKDILDQAKKKKRLRDNVNTVAILITDGGWNVGGDPRGTANLMKDRATYDVEFFTVGVGRADMNTLRNISGSSNAIYSRSFNQFSNLATRIRGDQIEKLYQPVDDTNCGKTCDPKAACSCGTISGVYMCSCGPGYYGSGDPGRCSKCPYGSYKTFPSPDPCITCPPHSTTHKLGATSVSDCKCRVGYQGNPGTGQPCDVVKCPTLPTKLKNGKVTNCGSIYLETCTFICDANHHVAMEDLTSRKLLCQKDGRWSKTVPECVPVLCQWAPIPFHSIVSCTGQKVGNKCSFSCKPGYRLNGTNVRECRSTGHWSYTAPSCSVVKCPALRKLEHVEFFVTKCLNQATDYPNGCTFACKIGYKRVKGSEARDCQDDGTWSGSELVCKDLTPPSITCPSTILADTDPHKASKNVIFEDPVVTDNSLTTPGATVLVIQSPASIKSPHDFPIGVTWIYYSAVDQAGNTANCSLRVEIKDREAPRFTYCPQDITVTTPNPWDISAVINWKEPVYTDNSGYVTVSYQSGSSPMKIPVGPKQAVVYTIQDKSKKTATCQFFIKAEAKTCPARQPPLNGARACGPYQAGLGITCTISCNEKYDPNGVRADVYLCNMAGKWIPFPPYAPSQWPDCTVIATREGMGQRIQFYYYSGDCHTSIDARKQISRSFIYVLDKYLQSIHQGGCSTTAHSRICKAKNVDIKCGKLTGKGARRRRSSQANAFTLTLDVEVKSKEDSATLKQAVHDLTDGLQKVTTLSTHEANRLKSISVGSDSLILNTVTTVGSVTGVCAEGQVFGVVNSTAAKVEKCVACLSGKYYSRKERICKECPKGTYTEIPGRLGCSNCPIGTTTMKAASANKTDCREPCLSGTFSKTGLANCEECPKGYYQPENYAKSCLKCPGSTTTKQSGTKHILGCGMICARGTYSESGVEPCLPCPRGYYQEKRGQLKCLQCDSPFFTYGTGATDKSQCRSIDICLSNPCLNGGQCHNEVGSYRCQCPDGYNGINCEIEVNECSSNPCFGKAVCVDKVKGFKCVCPRGYQGIYCADRAPECTASLCKNGGVCFDTDEGFSCSCKAGWTGTYCEGLVNECASSPCLNNGYCVDSLNGFSCQCPAGFTGTRCETNIDNCEKNSLCLNGGDCVDGVDDFSCTCAPGYAGPRCAVDIDECASNPCRNDGACVDEVNGYTCNCAPTFHGDNCQNRQTDVMFDLEFTRGVQGYANKTLHKPIKQLSLTFWVKASSDDVEAGSVASYAVEENGQFNDNAFVLRDFNHFLLVVNNQQVETKITANDDAWHHVAVTWKSSDGSYKAFKDGLKTAEGTNFQIGQTIAAGGTFVLGQEQDEVGRNFSASEAFAGSLSQVNLFDHVLSDQAIAEMSRYRCEGVLGNIIAWPDFLLAQMDIKKTLNFCKVKNVRFHPWNNRGPKTAGVESEPSDCPGKATAAHCLSVADLTSVKDSNLKGAVCNTGGYTCRDVDQKKDNGQATLCEDYRARFECPYTGSNNCGSSPCLNGGSCIETLSGYRCLCVDGTTGSNCDKAVPCRNILAFANGKVTQAGATASFSCNSGYQLSGPSSLTCSGGKWNTAVPKCIDINECLKGNGGCNHQCVNTPGSFRCVCSHKFRLSGNTCIDFDECSVNKGNCQNYCVNSHGTKRCSCPAGYSLGLDLTSCKDLNECLGSNKCSQVCVNQLGTYKCACQQGFTLNADGKSCDRISCPTLSNPSYGVVTQTNKDFESDATYQCNTGYRVNGPTARRCQADRQYSGYQPTCEPVKCGILASPFNGQSKKNGRNYGNYYSFWCLSGNLLIGSTKRTCQQSGRWSGVQPRCVPYHCSPLSAPANGRIIGTSLIEGSSVIIQCDVGYQLDNANHNFRTCQADKSWSQVTPTCVVVNCGAPKPLNNGTITGSVYTYGSVVTYKCNKDSGLSGVAQRSCQENGQWSGVDPQCLWHSCSYPDIPTNGKIDSNDFSFGSVITYTCDVGYKLTGSVQRQCLDDGFWSDSIPTCTRINCGNPGLPQHGEIQGADFTYLGAVIYDCKAGYSLVGNRIRQCQLSGQWTGALPSCVAGKCGSASLVGPTGTLQSPNYPSSYVNNLYCRWAINVASTKKATVTIKDLKMEKGDHLEVRDGSRVISILSGVLPAPVIYASSSNNIDVRFLSDGTQTASASGFDATYSASICGGLITAYGSVIMSPGFLSGQYPPSTTCVWQINVPGDSFEMAVESFHTQDSHDKLEAYKSITDISSNTFIGSYFGYRSSFKIVSHTGSMYLKFSTDPYYQSVGFKATLTKFKSSLG